MADDLAITADDVARCDVGERNLVALRYLFDQLQTAPERGPGLQTAAVRDDRDVVVRMHADVERLGGGGLHVESSGLRPFEPIKVESPWRSSDFERCRRSCSQADMLEAT